jgi:hypothetical protein
MNKTILARIVGAALASLAGPLYAQHDQVVANADGATVRADINSALAALFSLSSGSSAPSTTVAYQLWADSTTNTLKRRNAANTGWIVLATLDETFTLARSSNTVLDISDVGKTIRATGNFTQTLDAAATLGDGWWVRYINEGSSKQTIDPNGAETIDGASSVDLWPGDSAVIVCNGTNFKTFGLYQSATPQNSQSASYTTVLSDANKHLFHPAADNNIRSFAIASNATVPYPIGTTITFVNMSAAILQVSVTTDTLYLSGPGTTGTRTLAANGIATALKISATEWIISGVGLS